MLGYRYILLWISSDNIINLKVDAKKLDPLYKDVRDLFGKLENMVTTITKDSTDRSNGITHQSREFSNLVGIEFKLK